MAWGNYYGFRPYVPVAQRRHNAEREAAKLQKKGVTLRPIRIDGRNIAHTFWGEAWCENLESYSDYANRLPRGRTYVRNGSVVHLDIREGEVEAIVSGSELYRIKINITPVVKAKWRALCQECAGGIGSLLELLQGRLSDRVMGIITKAATGLFPSPKEIAMNCSCPDWAGMCKHLAAVLYGVGRRLDQNPELLFVLRSVNHEELISQAASATDLTAKMAATGPELSESEIGDVFGIELDKHTPAEELKAEVPSKTKVAVRTKSSATAKPRGKTDKTGKTVKPKPETKRP
jgi:uncharacterized Zn finger protein